MKRLHENAIKPPKRLLQPADTRHFVKIIHKKKPLLRVYSHIKLSSYFRYVLFQVITQFDMTANPP